MAALAQAAPVQQALQLGQALLVLVEKAATLEPASVVLAVL
jgi:hypothetical protein